MTVDESVIEQMRMLNASDEDIQKMREKIGGDDPDIFEVWPDNSESFFVFDRVGTQWSVAQNLTNGALRRIGLDYAKVKAALEMLVDDPSERKRIFVELMDMERQVLMVDSGVTTFED